MLRAHLEGAVAGACWMDADSSTDMSIVRTVYVHTSDMPVLSVTSGPGRPSTRSTLRRTPVEPQGLGHGHSSRAVQSGKDRALMITAPLFAHVQARLTGPWSL